MRLIDLFAGCGGMTAGFVDAGFEPVLAVEWDLSAAATYAANFGGDHTFWGDIADVDDDRIRALGEIDVVVGGPPCQGFSNLGTRDPDDPRNKLWREYMRVILAARPKVFVIENVDRFARSREYEMLVAEVEDGLLAEYRIATKVLNAADYGVPQRRHRTIVIGSRVGEPAHPEPSHSRNTTLTTKRWRTTRHAFRNVPWDVDTTCLPSSFASFFGRQVPGIFKGLDIHVGRNPTARSLNRYDCVPPGGGRFDLPDHLLPDCWRNKPTGTTDVMGRMRWDQPSLTVRTEFFKPEKGQYLHPQWEEDGARVNRPITHLEAARLQTFPRDFLWCGSKLDIARQIGNAVPAKLAAAIACYVRDSLS
jgi:DNA (cytosine-5)-methyltransferase 1